MREASEREKKSADHDQTYSALNMTPEGRGSSDTCKRQAVLCPFRIKATSATRVLSLIDTCKYPSMSSGLPYFRRKGKLTARCVPEPVDGRTRL